MLSAIITAAGKSTRFKKEKKQFLKIGDDYLFMHSIKKLKEAGANEIILVVDKEDNDKVLSILKERDLNVRVVLGGDSRQKSVSLGFKSVTPDDDLVIIHDAARPFVKVCDIKRVLEKADTYGAAILATRVCDTVKKIKDDLIMSTIDRNSLILAQTPQIFKKKLFAKTSFLNENVTDEAFLFESYGFPVHYVIGSGTNIKITYQDDLKYAEFLVNEGFLWELVMVTMSTSSQRVES